MTNLTDKIAVEDADAVLRELLTTRDACVAAAIRADGLPDGSPEQLGALVRAQLACHLGLLGALCVIVDQLGQLDTLPVLAEDVQRLRDRLTHG